MPAKAGTQIAELSGEVCGLGSRLRGNDIVFLGKSTEIVATTTADRRAFSLNTPRVPG